MTDVKAARCRVHRCCLFLFGEPTMKLPKGALNLFDDSDQNHHAIAVFSENETPQLNMTIYSGGLIKNHWFWDDLILDLSGIVLPQNKYPIFQDHDWDLIIAHTQKPIVDKNLRVDPNKTVFHSTPESEKFRTVSAEGFPYQASAGVRPLNIERIKPGATAEANGIKLKGPGTIFRKWIFREGSVTCFGYDSNTKSAVFSSKEAVDVDCTFAGDKKYFFMKMEDTEQNQSKEGRSMDLTELKEKHPDLVNQIEEAAAKKAKDEFAAERKKIEDENKAATEQLSEVKTRMEAAEKQNSELSEKVVALEKENDIRAERERQANLKADAEQIWNEELSKCSIPKRLHAKVKQHISPDKFVSDEGPFDKDKFREAAKAEIKTWGEFSESESIGSEDVVQGESYSRDTDADAELAAEKKDDEWVEAMLARTDAGIED